MSDLPHVHPVIMCGGAGTRLWPASRPASPKQFIGLVEDDADRTLRDRSLFERTVDRVARVSGFASLVVVAGVAQRGWVEAQLDAAGQDAFVILEPEGRDSAPAVAAALHHIARRDPEGIAVVVASDHHIPDAAHFARDLDLAVEAAREGRIVTLGIRPTWPSPAFGYIRPSATGEGAVPIAAFVEKPDEATARTYIDEGYLWNSGNFIAPVATFLEELEAHAPDVSQAVAAALPRTADPMSERTVVLDRAFRDVRKTSVDYAVMERTQRASVLPTDIEWSDLGAWDAVLEASARDDDGNSVLGDVLLEDVQRSLVRGRDGHLIAVLGLEGVAVVAEADVTLVASLDRAQDVKAIVDRLKADARPQVDAPPVEFSASLAADHLGDWLCAAAYPLWLTNGFDAATGLWHEALKLDGSPADERPRARIPGRQAWAFAQAPRLGWNGPFAGAINRAVAAMRHYRVEDGLMRALVERDGSPASDEVHLYDQTFALLALSASTKVITDAEARADAILDAIERRFVHDGPGFRETGDEPFQSNAHMHLLEASISWIEAGGGPRWSKLAEMITALAAVAFIEPERGFLRETFTADWTPSHGASSDCVEPGHQFEWAWLLTRWSKMTDDRRWRDLAEGLFRAGLKGVDPKREVAVDTMDEALQRTSGRARLWPQAEWLRAALALRDTATDEAARGEYERQAGRAWRALDRYLAPQGRGLWADKLRADGTFEIEPSPASSFYHIVGAALQLRESASRNAME